MLSAISAALGDDVAISVGFGGDLGLTWGRVRVGLLSTWGGHLGRFRQQMCCQDRWISVYLVYLSLSLFKGQRTAKHEPSTQAHA